MKTRVPAWLALGLIAIVSGLLLSMTNEVTKGVIEQRAVESAIESRKNVLKDADAFDPLGEGEQAEDPLYAGKSDEAVIGYVSSVTVTGFGGPIEITAGVDLEGLVTGISVGGASFAETAGLGAKAKDEAFREQFVGKQTPLQVIKAGEEPGPATIDAITAATITTRAVTSGVNKIASRVNAFLHPELEEEAPAEGITYTASEQGFAGPVTVYVTIREDGTISRLKVGDEQFKETAGLGELAREAGFTDQFIGKSLPLAMEDIDALSGATITTKAVLAAIHAAYETGSVFEQAATTPEGLVYTAVEKGFAGPVAVSVRVKDDGTVTQLEIGDDDFAETAGLGELALEKEFRQQFIGKTLPIALEDIDGISGATVTTRAVITAVNRAYAEGNVEEGEDPIAVETPVEVPIEITEVPTETTPVPVPVSGEAVSTAVAQGFAGPVEVQASFAQDGSILWLKVGGEGFAETPGLGAKALDAEFTEQFVGKTPPLKLEDIDGISGATVTTEAVLQALNEAGESLAPASEESIGTAVAQGFAGPVEVQVSFAQDGSILWLKVGGEGFAETPGLGAKALDAEFTEQFVGKTPPLKPEDIDGISGATVTTEAVLQALNEAGESLAPASEESIGTAVAQGFAGPVEVQVSFAQDGSILWLKVGGEGFAETPGLGAKALDAEFTEQFVGKMPPLKPEDIDGISGATVTTEAVLQALNEAAVRFFDR